MKTYEIRDYLLKVPFKDLEKHIEALNLMNIGDIKLKDYVNGCAYVAIHGKVFVIWH